MIATHNVKVNDRWYSVGEILPEQETPVQDLPEQVKVEAVDTVAEEPQEAPKKTSTRRKTTK